MSRFVSGGETTGKVLRRMVVWGAGVGCGGSAGRRTEKLERTEELKTNGVGGGLCGQRFRVQRSNDNGNSLQVGLLLS